MSDANATPAGQTAGETAWRDLCALADVPANGGKYVAVDRRPLAVFRLAEDKVHVLDDMCPHAGGSLSGGYIANGVVHCPWHGWPFKLENGQCPDNGHIRVCTYPTRVVEGRVQVQV